MASREEAGLNARDHEPAGYRLRGDVTITSSVNPQTSRKQYYVKSGETGDVFELGEEEYFFCVRLDGRVSFAEFRHAFESHFGATLTFEKFKSFADDLVRMRVLEETSGDAFAKAASALIEDILDPEDRDPRATPFRRTLADPSNVFETLSRLAPLGRVLSLLVWPLLGAAVAILFRDGAEARAVYLAVLKDLSIFIAAPVGLFAVNLVVRVIQGAVAHREGATIRGLGVLFYFGLLPRFYLEDNAITALGFPAQRRIHAAALLTRLFLASTFTLLWAVFRRGEGFPAEFFMLIGHMAFVSFLWSAVPLLRNDGYRWMVSLLRQPHLRGRSFTFLRMRLAGKPAPPDMTATDQTCAILYGLACLLYMAAIVILVFSLATVKLEQSLGGPGVVIATAFVGLAIIWYMSSRHAAERVRKEAHANRAANRAAAAGNGGAVIQLASRPAHARAPAPAPAKTPSITYKPAPRKRRLWLRFAWSAAALGFLLLLLMPYQYKPGGEFAVLPSNRHEVRARIDGEIAEIHIREGQWVEEGAPVVRLDNWELARRLAESEAELDRAKAVLARLKAGAKPEEVALARSKVTSASAHLGYKKTELARAEELLKEGVTTVRAVELRRSEHSSAYQDLKVAEAQLKLVKSGATAAEIDAAKAEIRRLENEVAFRKEDMTRTEVFAPAAGAIVTANPDLRAGAYQKTGDLIAEIEDTRVARIEINLAEGDLRYIKVGDRVQIKPWGYSHETLYGTVAGIAPTAEKVEGAYFIRVLTEMPNEEGKLRPEMTGYAKVEGEKMQVWRAFTLFFIRFVEVEVWSWIP